MDEVARDLQDRVKQVQGQIAAAAERVGRRGADVQWVVASKYAPPEIVQALYQLGIRDFGENRVQALVQKHAILAATCPGIRWHFIGHLQTNKVKKIVPLVTSVQSVDRVEVAEALERSAEKLGCVVPVLLQVNVAGEAQKQGFHPDALPRVIPPLLKCRSLRMTWLMTMPPWCEDPEEVRPVFRKLRQLRDVLNTNVPGLALSTLSMGMSGDFQVAIEEGASVVRIGSALFKGGVS